MMTNYRIRINNIKSFLESIKCELDYTDFSRYGIDKALSKPKQAGDTERMRKAKRNALQTNDNETCNQEEHKNNKYYNFYFSCI